MRLRDGTNVPRLWNTEVSASECSLHYFGPSLADLDAIGHSFAPSTVKLRHRDPQRCGRFRDPGGPREIAVNPHQVCL